MQYSISAGCLTVAQIETAVAQYGAFAPYVEYLRSAGLVSPGFQVSSSSQSTNPAPSNPSAASGSSTDASSQTPAKEEQREPAEDPSISGEDVPVKEITVVEKPNDSAESVGTIPAGTPVTVTAGTDNGYMKLEATVNGTEITGYAPVSVTNDDGETVELFATDVDYEVAWEETKNVEPTCEDEGIIVRLNALSEIEEEETIPALGHDYEETSRTEPTCTEDGEIISTCTVCGDEQIETVPALGHDEGEWATAKDAGVFTKGLRELRCTRDDAVLDTEEIPQIVPVWAVVVGCVIVAGVVALIFVVASERKRK